MTVMARRQPPDSWISQTHVDIGALAQRVTGLENGIQDIRGALGDLSKKLDAKPTNWWGIIGGLMAVLTVIGGSIGFLISPINTSLDRHERDISRMIQSNVGRSEYSKDHDEMSRWLESLRDRLRSDEDVAITRREFDTLARHLDEEIATATRLHSEMAARFEKSAEQMTSQAASRSEMVESARRTDDRVSSLASGLNELRHDFYMGRSPSAFGTAGKSDAR